jgi:hypothetical protein
LNEEMMVRLMLLVAGGVVRNRGVHRPVEKEEEGTRWRQLREMSAWEEEVEEVVEEMMR